MGRDVKLGVSGAKIHKKKREKLTKYDINFGNLELVSLKQKKNEQRETDKFNNFGNSITLLPKFFLHGP